MSMARGKTAGGCGFWVLLSLWVVGLSFLGTWAALWWWNQTNPCPCSTAAAPPRLPTVTPTQPLFPYAAQPGETLEDVARKFGVPEPTLQALNRLARPTLQPGQILLIPGTPPAPEADEVRVRIQAVEHPGALREERIQLVNAGSLPVNLAGWRLKDEDGNEFVFPNVELYPQGGLWVWTRRGASSPTGLFWGLQEPLLQPGETLTLLDPQGRVHDTYTVP